MGGDAVTVTIQTLDANDEAATTAAGVTVALSADTGTLSATSIALAAGTTSDTVTLTGAAVGSVTVTASATGLLQALERSHSSIRSPVLMPAVVRPSQAEALALRPQVNLVPQLPSVSVAMWLQMLP